MQMDLPDCRLYLSRIVDVVVMMEVAILFQKVLQRKSYLLIIKLQEKQQNKMVMVMTMIFTSSDSCTRCDSGQMDNHTCF